MWPLREQIDRNYGLTGGWLLTRFYGIHVIYVEWSPR